MHSEMHMCMYVYMNTQACDIWGFYCVDVLHLSLKYRFSRVTLFLFHIRKLMMRFIPERAVI